MDIVVIGSGGVAESLVFSLTQAGVAPRVIVSPTLGHADRLRDLYAPECTILHDLAEMPRNADIYLLAVTDTAIASCAAQMPSTSGVWLHTAACVPVETLTQYHPDSGIFYPLNTFSKGRPLSWQGIPLFVEHRSEIAAQAIQKLASLLHMEPRPSTLTLRQEIHVAAVFACNFVNHQWAIASELLEQHQILARYCILLSKRRCKKRLHSTLEIPKRGPRSVAILLPWQPIALYWRRAERRFKPSTT